MKDYLDLESNKYKKCKTIDDKFSLLANVLLNKCNLYVNKQKCNIEEIEFYYKSPDHTDIYVHCDEEQLNNSTWYVHKKGGTCKSGTFKGMDLTFGNKKKKIYGGILIRSLSSGSDFITGPCNVVNYLMKKLSIEDVSDYDKLIVSKTALDENNKLYIKECDEKDDIIFSGLRVGLSFKNLDYTFAHYRYLTHLNKIPKCRNTMISKIYLDTKSSVEEIVKLTGLSKASVSKAIADFKSGQEIKKYTDKMDAAKINKIYGWFNRSNADESDNESGSETSSESDSEKKSKKVTKNKAKN